MLLLVEDSQAVCPDQHIYFHACSLTVSGVTVGKVKAGILCGSDGVNEAAGGRYLSFIDQWM